MKMSAQATMVDVCSHVIILLEVIPAIVTMDTH